MRLLILCLAVTSAMAMKFHNKHPCDDKDCRAGRECVVVEGQAQCLCVMECPDHFKPVCGSDGVSYENHCKLHQKACLSASHISIEHKGHCKKSYDKLWKKDRKKSLLSKNDLQEELQNDLIKLLKKSEEKSDKEHKKGPAVCYAPQRNALRFLLVEHWEEDMKTQPWYSEGTTYREGLWGWFFTCDDDKNNFLTPTELLECAKDVAFFARPGQDNELTKALCIDALVNDGDRNQDWRLDFEEFTRVMDPKYQPKEKKCSLEGKNYIDGEEIHVDCNHCVCGVGNWVCASSDCADTTEQKAPRKALGTGESRMSNAIDEDSAKNDVFVEAKEWLDLKAKAKEAQKGKADFDVEDDNMFADYDLGEDEEEEEEEEELGLDEYYDDLETTKEKIAKNKKKKFQLTKALKEVKMLMKETEQLKKLLAKQKDDEGLAEKRRTHLKQKEATKAAYAQKKKKKMESAPLDPIVKKIYDGLSDDTDWNDLIDWGSAKKRKGSKNSALANNKL